MLFSSARDAGVHFKRLDLADGKWVLVSLGALDDAQLIRALVFCDTRVGMKYDWAAIVGFALPFGEHENNRRFCSDSCVELMERPVIATVIPLRIAQAVVPVAVIKLGSPIIQEARG